mmetsp:Transcript_94871/g.237934  ORF Transcript_94871/g.237934 Transcript_94871/m.237934 type:complete len:1751 (+) Transcript_94871:92-5344(+)
MGCCCSTKPLAEINAEVFGNVQSVALGRFFKDDGSITQPPQPKVPNPSQPLGAGSPSSWQGLEFAFQWGGAKVSEGQTKFKWDKAMAKAFECALLKAETQDLVCGREQILFAGPVAATFSLEGQQREEKNAGCVLLSSGRLLLVSLKKCVILKAYHLFDIREVSVSKGDVCTADISFDCAFPNGPGFCGPWNKRLAVTDGYHSLKLMLELNQVSDLMTALSKLSLVLRATKLPSSASEALTQRFSLPQPPCDGGFLAVFHATCNYFGLPLADTRLGKEFFKAVPYLELDVTSFKPMTSQLAAAIRTGLQRSSGLRGFVGKGTLIDESSWQELLPIFSQGTLMKVHMPACNLSPQQLLGLFRALISTGFNTVVDLDVSGSKLSGDCLEALTKTIQATLDSLRSLSLANCGICPSAAMPLLFQAIAAKASKLEKLNLAGNDIGKISAEPHPLASIWNPRLQSLNINNTGMDLASLMKNVQPKDLQDFRELGIANLVLPREIFNRFCSMVGPSFQRIHVQGVAKTSDEIAVLLNGLASGRAADNLDLRFGDGIDFANLISGLALATTQGKVPGSLSFESSQKAAEVQPVWNNIERQVAGSFQQVRTAGAKGSEAITQVWQQVLPILQASAGSDMQTFGTFEQLLGSITVDKLCLAPTGTSAPININISLYAGPELGPDPGVVQVSQVGFGPKLALALPGLSKNRKLVELDLRGTLGGDAAALALGSALKENRTLRSLHTAGNYFSHNGLTAIRSALYGNKKLVEFPFPTEDAQAAIMCYQLAMQAGERNVQNFRASIKRAFKSTKGRRTPHVIKTLNDNVELIKEQKQRMARFRLTIQKYGKIQQEIQGAIARNQQDAKNSEQAEKLQGKVKADSWKKAATILRSMDRLKSTKSEKQAANVQSLWTRRQEVAKAWTQKRADLKKKNQSVPWLDAWIEANTKEGSSLVVTRSAAESLLMSLPTDQEKEVKAEVALTRKLIKFESELEANEQMLNSKIEEQNLMLCELKSSPNWSPPPVTAVPVGLTNEDAQRLQKPVNKAPAKPPPAVFQAQVVAIGAGAGAGPVIQAQVVQGSVVQQPKRVEPPTPVMQQAQYEQYRVFQQQQYLQEQNFQQQQMMQQHKQPLLPHQQANSRWWRPAPNNRPYQNRSDPYYDPYYGSYYGSNDYLWCGVYMYSWHYHSYYNDYHYYNHYHYHDNYHYHDDHYDYDNYNGLDGCDWAEATAIDTDPDVGNWNSDYGGDVPPDYNVDGEGAPEDAHQDVGLEDVQEADDAVAMYAGGEDDRPGKGPHGGNSRSAVRSPLLNPTPARLDLEQWFKEKIMAAEENALSAVLGRVGPLPCHREVLLRTVEAHDTPEVVKSICLVTQCSVDRLPRLEQLLVCWPGELSVAVYVDAPAESHAATMARQSIRNACARAAAARAAGSEHSGSLPLWTIVALYQVDDSEVRCEDYDRLYPVNTLRNAALQHARADMVFLLDVDFVPSEKLFDVLVGADDGQKLRAALQGGNDHQPTALVIPAFEARRRRGGVPRDGAALRAAHEVGDVEGFHVGHFPKGHSATDFDRWLAGRVASRGRPPHGRFVEGAHGVDAYLVKYEEHFEPYVVALRSLVPAYDERFRGYGLNKISHLYSMHAKGFAFRTAADEEAFVVAEEHAKSQSWKQCVGPEADAQQRARIATHYANFKAGLQHVRCNDEAVLEPKVAALAVSSPAISTSSSASSRALPRMPGPFAAPTTCARSAQELADELASLVASIPKSAAVA